MSRVESWDHRIRPATGPDRICTRAACRLPAVFVIAYRYRSGTTSTVERSRRHLCTGHGQAWAARHGLQLPETTTAPADCAAGAITNPTTPEGDHV